MRGRQHRAGRIDDDPVDRAQRIATRSRNRIASGQLNYALSRTMNDSGGLNWYPANDYELAAEWARADFDRRHRMAALGSVTPAPHLTIGAALTVQSGLPYSELLGADIFNNGRGNARPVGVPRNTLEGAGPPLFSQPVTAQAPHELQLSARVKFRG